ncbi:MAG: exodeoxyribonuclease VII large subunit [Eubacteriales bacterium]
MKNVYSVKQVNEYIRNMFAQDFMMNRIYVKGEISNCKYHTSGHIYFSLKDESGTISCVMFAGQRGGLSFRMSEGMQVVALGSISTYARSGTYQLYANEIIQEGAGFLYERFEQLKKNLEEMGMFAPEYKIAIPKYAKKIGVVTAPTGAAIQDIIQIVGRRNPYVQVVLYPALVQGEGAAESIVKGIFMMENVVKPDVLIVGRGGGSIEDLWAFNEEIVAQAIFHCNIPIISAVGHETDTTIADYVADMRAPTPSAAAELATYEYAVAMRQIEEFKVSLYKGIDNKITMLRRQIEQYTLKIRYRHPGNTVKEKRFYLAEQEIRLQNRMENRLQNAKHQLAVYIAKMQGLSPLDKLNQGYSYVSNAEEKNIRSISDVRVDEQIKIAVTDGYAIATVNEIIEEEHYGQQS